MINRLKKKLPMGLLNTFANCGGTNLRSERFSANLLQPKISDEIFLGIMHSLIFPGGIRKTTSYARNAEIIKHFIRKNYLVFNKNPLNILDIGASAGLDAMSTYDFINENHTIERYVLGDLHTHILYDAKQKLMFDQDQNLIQVGRLFGFVAQYFECNTLLKRVLNLHKRLRPWILKYRYGKFAPQTDYIRIPLVHPDLPIDKPGSRFHLERMNVFEPIPGKYDFIICMHLLVPRYFSSEQIKFGSQNLTSRLKPGGYLLVGALEEHKLYHRDQSGKITEQEFKL